MSTYAVEGKIPEFTQGDRLRKARELTGLSSTEFAERIGVSQKTVNNAEADRTKVRPIVVNAWSLATGVPAEWLRSGVVSGPNDGGSLRVRSVQRMPVFAGRRLAVA